MNTLRVANIVNGIALIACTLGTFFMPEASDPNYATVTLTMYILFLATLMLLIEFYSKSLQEKLRSRLGFLFS
jgi:hypothetical protein